MEQLEGGRAEWMDTLVKTQRCGRGQDGCSHPAVFSRSPCIYDSGYKFRFAHDLHLYEIWKVEVRHWSFSCGFCLSLCLRRSWFSCSASVLWISGVQRLLWQWLLLSRNSGPQPGSHQVPVLAPSAAASPVPGASPRLVGAPKPAHAFAPSPFTELSAHTLGCAVYFLSSSQLEKRRGLTLRQRLGAFQAERPVM